MSEHIFFVNGKTIACPTRDVSPQEFRKAAIAEEWQDLTITLFLSSPLYHDYVKVGGEALRIRR